MHYALDGIDMSVLVAIIVLMLPARFSGWWPPHRPFSR